LALTTLPSTWRDREAERWTAEETGGGEAARWREREAERWTEEETGGGEAARARWVGG
jgi:hypothetical protein